jgi:hypothetical protein
MGYRLVVGSGSAWFRIIFGELNGEAQTFSVGFGLVVGKNWALLEADQA